MFSRISKVKLSWMIPNWGDENKRSSYWRNIYFFSANNIKKNVIYFIFDSAVTEWNIKIYLSKGKRKVIQKYIITSNYVKWCSLFMAIPYWGRIY